MSLFSNLGVRGEMNQQINIVGGIGAVGIGVASLIELYLLATPINSELSNNGLDAMSGIRSSRTLTIGTLEDEMVMAGMV